MKNNYLSFITLIALLGLLYGCDRTEEGIWMYEVREDGKFNFSSVLLDDFGVTVTLDSSGDIYQMVFVDWKKDSTARRVFFDDNDISAYHFCQNSNNKCKYYSFADDMDLMVYRELIEKGEGTIDVSRRIDYDLVEKKRVLIEDYDAYFREEGDIISYYSPSDIRYSKLDSSDKIKMEVTHNIKDFIKNGFHPNYFHYNLVEVGDSITTPWDFRGLPDTNVVQNFTLSFTDDKKLETAYIFYGTYSEKKDFDIGEEILMCIFDTIRVNKGKIVY
jgi:hypothetical protein